MGSNSATCCRKYMVSGFLPEIYMIVHHRGAEDTEFFKLKAFPLCSLCLLCPLGTVVKKSFHLIFLRTNK